MIITEIKKVPNPNIIKFYVREKFASKTLYFFDENCDKEHQQEFVKQLFKLNGITEVRVSPYEVSVSKAHSYSWEEIENDIVKILKNYEGEPNFIHDFIMFPFNILKICFGV